MVTEFTCVISKQGCMKKMYKIFSSKFKGYLTGIKYLFCLLVVVNRADLEQ